MSRRKEAKDTLLAGVVGDLQKQGKTPDVTKLDKELIEVFEMNDQRQAARKRYSAVKSKVQETNEFSFVHRQYGINSQRLIQRLKLMFSDPVFGPQIIAYSVMSSGQLGPEKRAEAEAKYRALIRQSNKRWGDWRKTPLAIDL